MKKPTHINIKSAFSLVELLVVIAVIAIIAAIAIPNIAGITGAANTAKAQRNAQNLASTFGAARAAGMVTSTADEAAAVAAMTNGVTVTIGNTSTTFRVDGLSSTEATAAQTYLLYTGTATGGSLQYTSTTN